MGFIVASTAIFVTVGRPVTLLILAGAINGLILPLALLSVLLGAHRTSIVGDYRHPLWMSVAGYIMVAFTMWLGFKSLGSIMTLFQK